MDGQKIGVVGGWVIFASGVALILVGALAVPGMMNDPDLGRLARFPLLLIACGIAASVTGLVIVVRQRRRRL